MTRATRTKFQVKFLAFGLVLIVAGELHGQDVDLVVLVDGSESATIGCEYPFELQASSTLVCGPSCCPGCTSCTNAFLPHDGTVWMSVVQFAGSTASVEVALQSLANGTSICNTISAIVRRDGSTPLAAAFQKAIDIFNASPRPTAERVVIMLTDQWQVVSNEETIATSLRTLGNPARISIIRFGTPSPFDPINPDAICGAACVQPCPVQPCTETEANLQRYANAANSPTYSASQPRGLARCIAVCDPSVGQDDYDTVIEVARGSICSLGLSMLPATLSDPVQSPEAALPGQDVTFTITTQTTAGLTRVLDYQWQRARSDAPSTWTTIAGACGNTLLVQGERPACGDSYNLYRCLVSTPCDQRGSPAKAVVFSAGADCNANSTPDLCDWIPAYQWTGTVGGTGTDVVGGEGQSFSFTGTVRDDAPGTAISPTGEVVYAGNFAGANIDLNPLETQSDLHSSNGSDDGFLTKLKRDGLAGDTAWSRSFGGTLSDKGYNVAVDQQDGSVYVTGAFRSGPVDFNRNGGCACPCTECFTSTGVDAFVNKYDASGNYSWTRVIHASAASNIVKPLGITVAPNQDVIVTGWYQGEVDFDPTAGSDLRHTGSGTSTGWRNGFVTRLTPAGNYSWTHIIANKSSMKDAAATGVTADSSATYISGWYGGNTAARTDFDPIPADGVTNSCVFAGPSCKAAVALTDAFIMKLDVSGNFVWVQSMGSGAAEFGQTDTGQGVALDGFGSIFLCGRFQGNASFDPANQNSGCDPMTQSSCHLSNGGDDVFLVKLMASTGAYVWSRTFGGPNNDWAISLATDPSGNALLTGYFCRGGSAGCQCDFDPDAALKDLRTSVGGSDVFLTQINSDGSYGWTRSWGGTSNDEGHGVVVTPGCTNNIWVTGVFQGTVDFDPRNATVNNKTSNGGIDLFVSKFGASTLVRSDCQNSNGVEDRCELGTGVCVKGDSNFDGVVNGRDIQPFIDRLLSANRCPLLICPADMNDNRILDLSDVPCFVNVLLGQSGCGSLCSPGGLLRSSDCNENGINDAEDIAAGMSLDCNHNFIPDECDLDANDPDGNESVSADVNSNSVPDECEPDCNNNSVPDAWDITQMTSTDVNTNGVPDECEPDCNNNNYPDDYDIAMSTSADCNANGIPDECETDCNENGVPDDCDIDPADPDGNQQVSADCNADGMPDECNLTLPPPYGSFDCNENGILDECDIASAFSEDANENGVPDECEESGLFGGDSMMGGPEEAPVDEEAAWEAFYEWSFSQCWGPQCALSPSEQFQLYLDKLAELGLTVEGSAPTP